jgi:hypothetical protein
MAVRVLKYDSDGFPSEINPAADDIDVRGVIIDASSGTGIDLNNKPLTNVPVGVAPGDAVNKGQLDEAILTGGKVKEICLHQNQFDDADGIYAAIALFFSANPISGDTITLYDGATMRTYGAGSGGDVQYTIGATAADSMQNFANAVTGDGLAAWAAVFEADNLDEINAGGVVVIYENSTAAGSSTSRAYGTWGTQANCQVVEYASGGTPDIEYDNSTSVNLPSSDPTEGRFGFRRQVSELIDAEIHDNRSDNYLYKWDETLSSWLTMTGPGSIPYATAASGGGTKGIWSADSDKGLDIAAGVGEVKVDDDGIQFNASGQLARKGQDKFKLSAGTGGVSKGDPIYVSANDTGLPADGANANSKKVTGVAEEAAAVGIQFDVLQEGLLASVTVGGSPAAGDIVWLDSPNGLTTTLPVGSPRYRHKIGTMKNATDLIIQMQYMGLV